MNRSVQMMSLALVVASATFALTMFTAPVQATRAATLEPSEIGSVDTFTLLDIGIMSEERESVRTEYSVKGDQTLTPLYENDASYKQQLNNMDPNDPVGGQIYQQYQANLNQLQQMTQQINAGYQELISRQIAEVYKEVYAATGEVAAEHGYVYVYSTRMDSELLQIDSIQGVTQEILSRPLLTPAAATDLTELVRVKLGLPTIEEIEAAKQAKVDAAEAEAAAAAALLEQVVQDATEDAVTEVEVEDAAEEADDSSETPESP
jgi:hypothetical protein